MIQKNVLLIAEDEPDISDVLHEQLWPLGYPIVTARTGKEMLEKIRSNPLISGVLSDINMPEMTGIEVLQKIREEGIDLPIIFLTGYWQKDTIAKALQLGALDYIEKPYKIEELKPKVAQLMEIGSQIKSVDQELAEMAAKYQIKSEDLKKFIATTKPLLLMKIKAGVIFNKKNA